VNKGEVSVSDIDKNLGKFDQTYMSDTFLQQIAGNTPINAVPADYSLTSKKFAFPVVAGISSKNLFDKNNVTSGYYVDNLTGKLQASADFFTSDFIKISPNTNYYKNTYHMGAWYDSKNFHKRFYK